MGPNISALLHARENVHTNPFANLLSRERGASVSPTSAFGDRVELSPLASRSGFALTILRRVEVRVDIRISDATGKERFGLSIAYERTELQFLSQEHARAEAPVEAEDPLAALKAYFSPEATARRIANFAISGFRGGDRDAWRDFILPAIQKGFADALVILGELPEEATETVDQTRSLVESRLADWVDGVQSEEAAA